MTIYRPILKSKPAEFEAWSKASHTVRSTTEPLFELVPTHGLTRDLDDFTKRLFAASQSGDAISVDANHLNVTTPVDTSGNCAIAWLGAEFAYSGTSMRPVLRSHSPAPAWAEAQTVAVQHRSGMCLRIAGDGNRPITSDLNIAASVMQSANVATADVHLLIDLGSVEDQNQVPNAANVANQVIAAATRLGTWASVTVGAGAFPASISSFPKGASTPVRRHEVDVWHGITATTVDFADYGVGYPAPSTAQHSPLPNLRYTTGGDWRVWRETRALPGNESFFTLCDRVVNDTAWARANYSWGDTEILRCSQSIGGAGNATKWRAYGVSHHLHTVTDHLARTGAP